MAPSARLCPPRTVQRGSWAWAQAAASCAVEQRVHTRVGACGCVHAAVRVHLQGPRRGRAGAQKAGPVDRHVWFSVSVATAAT